VTTWHATDEELTAYRFGTGEGTVIASIEAHLLACVECRRALVDVGGAATSAETVRRWAQVAERLDNPHSSGLSRITVSTRPLFSAWLLAMLLVLLLPLVPVLVVGVAAPTLLLAMAPLAPMAAVALAYRTSSDPAGELAGATPMAGLRAIAVRALVVSLAAAPLGIVAGLLLPFPTAVAFAWLLPGLAMSSVVLLAGTTRVDPTVVAGTLAVCWPLAVALPSTTRRIPAALVADWIAAPQVQLLMLAIAAVALVATTVRRDRVAYRRIT